MLSPKNKLELPDRQMSDIAPASKLEVEHNVINKWPIKALFWALGLG